MATGIHKIMDDVPPKTHNLLYLVNKIDKKPEQKLEQFITKLNTASVATRCPDDPARIQAPIPKKSQKT